MDINRGNMNKLFIGFNTSFKNGLKNVPVDYKPFSKEFPSSTATQGYPFLELFSGMREWIGDREIKNLSTKKLEVSNRDFEETVGVKQNNIEDDQYGLYSPMFEMLGESAARIWGELAYEALVKNGKWLDGSAFFLTTRKYGSNTINNKTTSALSRTTYGAARTAMMSYKGHNNKTLKSVPGLLVVGPALEETAKKILEYDYYVEAYEGDTDDATVKNHAPTPNIYKGTAKLLVTPELTGTYANYWFLMDTSGVIKPVGLQVRKKANKIIRKDRDTDDCSFFEGKAIYGTHARGEGFLTFPHLCYGGIVSA